MANTQTIMQVLAEIRILYPMMFDVNEERAAVWSLYLRDLPDDLLLAALKHYVATAKDNYPPSVPALRHAAAQLQRKAAGVPTAFEAWEDLLEVGDGKPRSRISDQLDETGRPIIEHVTRSFRHPLVETVARQLGWPKFPGDNPEADRAHFVKAYDAAVNKAMDEERELPEVRAWIEQSRGKALPGVSDLTARLTAG